MNSFGLDTKVFECLGFKFSLGKNGICVFGKHEKRGVGVSFADSIFWVIEVAQMKKRSEQERNFFYFCKFHCCINGVGIREAARMNRIKSLIASGSQLKQFRHDRVVGKSEALQCSDGNF